MPAENRAILLTPPGSGAIATIRMIGPQVETFLRRHFSTVPTPERCVHGNLLDGERLFDDPVVVMHQDGWVADVSLHAGPWIVQSVFDLARRNGFDCLDHPTLPLDDDAVDGDDQIEREVQKYLPMAHTELGLRALLSQPQAWRLLPKDRMGLQEMLDDNSLHWLLHPPKVAIIGIPNVGKSTLANQLFAQERSITSDIPGTTRDWVGELANIDGLAVMLMDTPGLRSTEDHIEAQAIKLSREQIMQADSVVLVLDATQPMDAQAELLMQYPEAIIVLNKVDQLDADEIKRFLEAIYFENETVGIRTGSMPFSRLADNVIRCVATTGQGVDELRKRLRIQFGCQQLDFLRPRCWTDRQRRQITTAMIQVTD